MGRKSSFTKPSDFQLMIRDLKEGIAEERNISIDEVDNNLLQEYMRNFILDLQNYFNEDWVKKIEYMSLIGATPDIIEKCIKYLNTRLNNFEKSNKQKEAKEKRQIEAQELDKKWEEIKGYIETAVAANYDKSEIDILNSLISDIEEGNTDIQFSGKKEKRYFLKKLNSMLDEIVDREAKKKMEMETEAKNLDRAIKTIEEIVEREYQAGNIRDKANYLSVIRDGIIGKSKDRIIKIKLKPETQSKLLQMLEDRINQEREQFYYEQVEAFTDGFKRPMDLPIETVNAMYGHKRIKFVNMEYHNRYFNLVDLIQDEECGEYLAIKKLINSDKISETDKRILEARKEYMDIELENKRKIGEIR